eukprot:5183413-Pleurochrysis_carterae.AAC.1
MATVLITPTWLAARFLACLIAFFITSQLTPERRSTCSTLATGSRGTFVVLLCDDCLTACDFGLVSCRQLFPSGGEATW